MSSPNVEHHEDTGYSVNNEQDSVFKIIALIKGKKQELTGVEDPTYMITMPVAAQRSTLRDYVASEFRDVVDSPDDITEIKYQNGSKVFYHFKYKEEGIGADIW